MIPGLENGGIAELGYSMEKKGEKSQKGFLSILEKSYI